MDPDTFGPREVECIKGSSHNDYTNGPLNTQNCCVYEGAREELLSGSPGGSCPDTECSSSRVHQINGGQKPQSGVQTLNADGRSDCFKSLRHFFHLVHFDEDYMMLSL